MESSKLLSIILIRERTISPTKLNANELPCPQNIKEASIVIEKDLSDGKEFTEGIYWKVHSKSELDEALLEEFES